MHYPEIRFRDPFLLIGAIYNDIEPAYMPPIAQKDERDKLSRETISDVLYRYEQAWRPYEEKLIHGACKLLGLEYRQNIIDIYAAPFYTSFSFPLFIATKYEPDRAVEVIIHELIHVLLYDNTSATLDLARDENLWKRLFPGVDDIVTVLHIPVHAVLRALFDDVLAEPERTLRDKEMCENYPSYKKAWDYVDEVGYKEIIQRLRDGSRDSGE